MPEKDYVTEPLKLSFSGVVAFDTLYKTLVNWLRKRNHYEEFEEKMHKTVRTEDGKKKLIFSWQAKKPVTDYVMNIIEIEANITNMQEVKKKGSTEKWYKGEYNFTFFGYLLKDYEDRWSRNALWKFLREVSDKYMSGSKFKEYEAELLADIRKLRAEVKAFLDLQKTV
ncbi:MAG: hypothetical protein AABW64_02765 [Nanoarchaeota archaeon]